ncbi:MAG: type I methionyl aminopeptidase [Candidatus Paceibacterota bacterium]|jgi:methionyl aminopeptidase
MIFIKTPEEIEKLREGGKRLAEILYKVKDKVAPGISTHELDLYAYELIRRGGDEPAFLNYKPEGASHPYPASLCTSINNEVVHGIPKINRVLKEGDVISIDLGLKHKGLYTDMALTVPVGIISKASAKLLEVTEKTLYVGINEAVAGARVGDIGAAIEKFIKPHKYGIVRELSGHGVGREIHEDPYIPNFGKKGTGAILRPGMVVAIEPMINEGTKSIIFDNDGYTVRTADGKKSAHFECTILITESEPEILTKTS